MFQFPKTNCCEQMRETIMTEKNTFLSFAVAAGTSSAEEQELLYSRRRSEPACLGKLVCDEPLYMSDGHSQAYFEEARQNDLTSECFDTRESNMAEIHLEEMVGDVSDNSDCSTMAPSECELKEWPPASSLPWTVLCTQKNSFGHFSLVEEDVDSYERGHVRRHSEPVLLKYSHQNHAVERYITFGTSVKEMSPSKETCQQINSLPEKQVEELSQDTISSEVLEDAEDIRASESLGSQDKAKNVRLRPCKGKRLKFKKFLAGLHEQIEADPHGFILETIEWPSVFVDNELGMLKNKMLANLHAYRNDLILKISN